ncbi:sugar phosphate isomerase/epimerase family protein [Halobacillus litoralis]|uniref:Sugar phosphate isomerase/epimerase n=1 Tax=Halobacillus litoralis TaxID=45668 RepID=A0A410MBX5_9BACI|nr:sugar phosphate isomerase/epimerase [Halobacillus litoralis]QAS52183.1 sugar phosphate isomerase/epimerase [Halobacillus litoralis]
MSVGVLAHLFGKMSYKELAYKVGEKGFPHVQLALWKAFNDYDFSKPGRLSPRLAEDISEEFDKHDVSISVLACYLHFFHENVDLRRENIDRFKELIRYARFFGAPMVTAEVGKVQSDELTGDEWLIMKTSLEELVEEAEKWGVYIGIEPANDHLIGTAQSLKWMLEEVPSSHIGVVLDPGNLLHENNISHQDNVIKEAFDLLGSRIIAAHAKDRVIGPDGKIETVVPGKGDLNYELYMSLLEQYKPQVSIIMEAAREHQMLEAKSFIEQTREQARMKASVTQVLPN